MSLGGQAANLRESMHTLNVARENEGPLVKRKLELVKRKLGLVEGKLGLVEEGLDQWRESLD